MSAAMQIITQPLPTNTALESLSVWPQSNPAIPFPWLLVMTLRRKVV